MEGHMMNLQYVLLSRIFLAVQSKRRQGRGSVHARVPIRHAKGVRTSTGVALVTRYLPFF